MSQESVNKTQDPVNKTQDPVNQDPVNQESVNKTQDPVNQDPVNQESVTSPPQLNVALNSEGNVEVSVKMFTVQECDLSKAFLKTIQFEDLPIEQDVARLRSVNGFTELSFKNKIILRVDERLSVDTLKLFLEDFVPHEKVDALITLGEVFTGLRVCY